MSAFGALAPFGTLGLPELKPLAAAPTEAHAAGARRHASTFGDVDDDIDAVDAVDLELFPIFEEEALELLPKLAAQLRDWARQPTDDGARRRLHAHAAHAEGRRASRRRDAPGRNGAPARDPDRAAAAGAAVVDADDVEVAARPLRRDGARLRRAAQPRRAGLCRRGRRRDRARRSRQCRAPCRAASRRAAAARSSLPRRSSRCRPRRAGRRRSKPTRPREAQPARRRRAAPRRVAAEARRATASRRRGARGAPSRRSTGRASPPPAAAAAKPAERARC